MPDLSSVSFLLTLMISDLMILSRLTFATGWCTSWVLSCSSSSFLSNSSLVMASMPSSSPRNESTSRMICSSDTSAGGPASFLSAACWKPSYPTESATLLLWRMMLPPRSLILTPARKKMVSLSL